MHRSSVLISAPLIQRSIVDRQKKRHVSFTEGIHKEVDLLREDTAVYGSTFPGHSRYLGSNAALVSAPSSTKHSSPERRIPSSKLAGMRRPPLVGRAATGRLPKSSAWTREEVCQYLTLLRRLPPDLVSAVEKEKQPAALRKLSYRKLLAIARSDQALRHG